MTTFAPPSHDAEHHDLSGHALPPPSDDMPAVTSSVNGVANHQSGVANESPAPAESSLDTPMPPAPLPVSNLVSKDDAPLTMPPAVSADTAEVAPAQPAHAVPDAAIVQPSIEPAVPVEGAPVASEVAPAPEAELPPVDPTSTIPEAPQQPLAVPASTVAEPPLDLPMESLPEPSTATTVPLPIHSEHVKPKAVEDTEMTDASLSIKPSRDREEDDDVDAPSAKRARTDDAALSSFSSAPPPADTQTTSSSDQAPVVAPAASNTSNVLSDPSTQAVPLLPAGLMPNKPAPYVPPKVEDYGAMVDDQKKRLLDGMRNLKKSKHANAFAKPVDPDALKLPTYRSIVTTPMDLSTMEQKLKDDQYQSVNQYVVDFDRMVQNAIDFNGQAHPVAQAGQVLRSQLTSQLAKIRKPGEQPAAGLPKKPAREPAPAIVRDTARRNPRPSLGSAQSPVAPLDGTPIIRRGSNLDDRPKRKIQKPAPRDLSYAKAPKKKFQGELKFADEVLTEMTRPRYIAISQPFLEPVDPVALNIPNYFKVIKKPMDIGTVTKKLQGHQYENLKEFETDFRQIFINCFKFNPVGTAVYTMGKQYEDVFNAEMKKKDDRLAVLAPASAAQSPVDDSEEDEDVEDEDDEEGQRMAKIRALNEQVAAIQQQAQELMAASMGKVAKKGDKGKGGKAAKQRKSSGGVPSAARAEKKQAKPKAQAKKVKPLTSSQKQEIAERIGELPTDEIARVAEQIKASLRRAGKPVPADEDMEFQIDDIPDDLLHELLIKVRKQGPAGAGKEVDDDFASPPARAGGGYKPKKNKPMTKSEQEEQINRLEGQLATFQGPGGEGMFGDDNQDDSSEDDSGSESEEE